MDELQAIASAAYGGARYGVKIRLPHALVMTVLFRKDLTVQQKVFTVLKLAYRHARNLAIYVAGYKSGLVLLKWLARMHCDHLLRSHNENNGKESGSIANFSKFLGQKIISFLLHGTTSPISDPSMPRELAPPGFPERYHHALIAGAISSAYAWGEPNALNYQVLLYVCSRVAVGTWKRLWFGGQTLDHSRESNGESNSGNRSLTPSSVIYRVATALAWGTAMILFEESPQFLHSSMRKSMDEIYRFEIFGAPFSSPNLSKGRSNLMSAGEESPQLHKK